MEKLNFRAKNLQKRGVFFIIEMKIIVKIKEFCHALLECKKNFMIFSAQRKNLS